MIFAVLPVKSACFVDLSSPVFDVPPIPPEHPASTVIRTISMATRNLVLAFLKLFILEVFSKLGIPIFFLLFQIVTPLMIDAPHKIAVPFKIDTPHKIG